MRIRVNGQDGDHLSTQDRGISYGDGLFETLPILHGVAQHWMLHRARLLAGCQRLRLPLLDIPALEQDITALCNGVAQGVLKVIITRGIGGRGYRPPDNDIVQPTRIVQVHPWPPYDVRYWSEGIQMRVCAHRLAHQPALAGMKHLNRLDQVLARAEWADDNIPEGFMLDTADQVIGGTMSNVFFVSNSVLHTPDVTQCGIAGVTRHRILEQAARMGMAVKIGQYTLEAILAAEELFVCNSVIGMWPVVYCNGRSWGRGPFTAKLTYTCG